MLGIDSKKLKAPFLIHSDIFNTFNYIKNAYKNNRDKDQCALHLDFLINSFGKENLIFPAFNYDFPKSKVFDAQKTPSQVGYLTNYLLSNSIFSRTKTPIFSFLTDIPELNNEHSFPFSKGSVFDFLYQNDGSILFYGTNLNSCTYLHFVEEQFGPPIYRYDKQFSGALVDKGVSKNINVNFHVRPLGLYLDYDWQHIFELLKNRDAIYQISGNFFAVQTRDISMILQEAFSISPYILLDSQSKILISNKIEKLGRRFELQDFE